MFISNFIEIQSSLKRQGRFEHPNPLEFECKVSLSAISVNNIALFKPKNALHNLGAMLEGYCPQNRKKFRFASKYSQE